MIEVARIDLHMKSGVNPKFKHAVHGDQRWSCNLFVEFDDLDRPEVQNGLLPAGATNSLKAPVPVPIESFILTTVAQLEAMAGDRPMKVASLVYYAPWLARSSKFRRK